MRLALVLLLGRWVVGDDYEGRPCAFLDANFDGTTDIVAAKGEKLVVFLGRMPDLSIEGIETFVEDSHVAKISLPSGISAKTIVNCGVGDLNGDAYPDLLLSSVTNDNLQVYFCPGIAATQKSLHINCTGPLAMEWTGLEAGHQPSIMDVNGDGCGDIFFPKLNSKRQCVYLNGGENGSSSATSECFKSAPTPHAFFVHSLLAHWGEAESKESLNARFAIGVEEDKKIKIEIWQHTSGEPNWDLVKTWDPFNVKPVATNILMGPAEGELKKGFMIAADLDADGNTELVLPTCGNPECSKLLFYVSPKNTDIVDAWSQIEVPLTDANDKSKVRYAWPEEDGSKQIRLRVGDFNLDGFPDLLIILHTTKGKSSDDMPALFIIDNVKCNGADCTWRRKLSINWLLRFTVPRDIIKGLSSVQFFDFGEDGNLDLLIGSVDGKSQKFTFLKSDDKGDISFLKVQVYSSTCGDEDLCRSEPYGIEKGSVSFIAAPGAVVRYRMSQGTGYVEGVATQVSQSSHGASTLPYLIFGLGRTPNFVDSVKVGVWSQLSSKKEHIRTEDIRTKTIPQLVPNSRLYVVPVSDAGSWQERLYVTPGRLILISFLALCALCVGTLFVIAALHWKERREDAAEKMQERHRFHFDAM